MNTELFSFKELYDVYLKLTYSIDVGKKHFSEGETIAKFDKIQVAGLQENNPVFSARGGFDNRSHVFWDATRELNLAFSQGVFSKTHFALLANSRLFEIQKEGEMLLTKTEEKESNEEGIIELEKIPVRGIFVYRKDNGEKVINYQIDNNIIKVEDAFTNFIIEYKYNYENDAQVIKIGRRLIQGYLEFEGKTRIKDDVTGRVVTGLIKIPKLKLMSDLSMRLGAQTSPVIANFQAVGVPVGARGTSHVCEFYFLNNDIDSDF